MSISSRSGVKGLERLVRSKIKLYWDGKGDSFSGWKLSKLLIILKNCSNKSIWALHFVQKSQWAHMSISPNSGGQRLQRSVCSKSDNVQKWEMDSLWGSMLPKIRITSKKGLNKSSSELNLIQKSPQARMSISPTSGIGGLQRSVDLISHNIQK